jgi:eukaryotic-like serine/threonine-protein kinase
MEMMQKMIGIKLPNGIYQYDPDKPLGPRGGFGIVYQGFSESYGNVAIKHIGLKANREIHIATELLSGQFKHIIPMYDAGQDSENGNNYIVMAQAEKSLKDEMIQKKLFSEQEAISILIQILDGILEVPKLSHRDLKPSNILFHDNLWKIADFGIAKFIEDTTSLETLNECLTPQYAAPEQWEYKHATNALDIYALGCISYSLLTGKPPFQGSREELRHQHLFTEPPRINGIDDRLSTIIYMMLRKSPEPRPSAARILLVLDQFTQQKQSYSTLNLSSLSQAAATVSEQNAKEEVKKLLAQDEKERRKKLLLML